jgi:prepilin-type N-terminal cleavage/methylation domain-containing protein
MLRVDTERRFLPRFKNLSLAPSNVSKGFTLIEVLIALVILSFSLLALAGLMVMTTKNNSYGSHITEAVTFAQDKLEEFRAVRPQAPPLGDIPDGLGADEKAGATGINYTRNWNVVTNGDLRTITITIDWNDRINHSIKLLSVLSQ